MEKDLVFFRFSLMLFLSLLCNLIHKLFGLSAQIILYFFNTNWTKIKRQSNSMILRLVPLTQQKRVVAGHYGVTVKLNCGLLDRKCHHFPILSYPTFLWNVVIISVWIWPWPLTSHQNLISSSNWMSVPNLKNFPQGIPEIPRSKEWEEQTDNPKT